MTKPKSTRRPGRPSTAFSREFDKCLTTLPVQGSSWFIKEDVLAKMPHGFGQPSRVNVVKVTSLLKTRVIQGLLTKEKRLIEKQTTHGSVELVYDNVYQHA